jgi:hypothetical protein
LFWLNTSETNWYYSDDGKLFDHNSDHPIVRHCPEFAQRITKIELHLERLEVYFEEVEPPGDWPQKPGSTNVKAQYFWEKVRKAFPAVKRVVLTGLPRRRPLPPPPGRLDEGYTAIETAVKCAPSQIVVQVTYGKEHLGKPQGHVLCQMTEDVKATATWQVIDEDWTPTRILLPPRKFPGPGSPLGDLLMLKQIYKDQDLEAQGLKWLIIESYARYALNSVILCPVLDCDLSFTERSQWQQHLANTDDEHQKLGIWWSHKNETTRLLCFKGTPDAEKAAIEARKQRINAAYQQAKELQRRIRDDYGKEGTEKRRLYEEQFFAQLREENFAVPGELLMGPGIDECYWIDSLAWLADQALRT